MMVGAPTPESAARGKVSMSSKTENSEEVGRSSAKSPTPESAARGQEVIIGNSKEDRPKKQGRWRKCMPPEPGTPGRGKGSKVER